MFKSFTLAVLPFVVLGKGENDGSNGENAVTTKLMDTDKFTLNLHHYNSSSGSFSEFHGDLDLVIKTGAISNQEYGFCFMKTDMYDCMSVMTNLDPVKIADDEDPEYASKFAFKDGFFNGTFAELAAADALNDDKATEDSQQFNWKNISSKSYKTCKEDESTDQPADGNKIVTCENVNAHWYRNFMTVQEDVVLDIRASPRVEYKIKGYRLKHIAGDLGSPSGGYEWGEEQMITMVTENYQKMVNGVEDAGTLGTSDQEPIVTELMNNDNVILTLGHYNTKGNDDDENVFNNSKFHGDLSLVVKSGMKEISTQEFGYCIQYAGATRWDCLKAIAFALPAKIEADVEYGSNIDMVDTYWIGTDLPSEPVLDARLKADDGWLPSINDKSKSWANIKTKTYMTCQLDSAEEAQPSDDAGWKFIECEKINAHFERNFITVGEDLMLDSFSDTKYEVIGFQRDHQNADFSDDTSYNWGEPIADFMPVVASFRQKQQDTTDGEEGGTTVSDNTEDSAAQFGAYAAVIMAGLATLCF